MANILKPLIPLFPNSPSGSSKSSPSPIPTTPPKVISSVILNDKRDGILVTWDMNMQAIGDIHDWINIKINSNFEGSVIAVTVNPSNRKQTALVLDREILYGDAVEWIYSDGSLIGSIRGENGIEALPGTYSTDVQILPDKFTVAMSQTGQTNPTMFTGVNADIPYDPETSPTCTIRPPGEGITVGSVLIETNDEITGVHWKGNNDITHIYMLNAETVTHFESGNGANPGSAPTWAICDNCLELREFSCANVSPGMKSIAHAWKGCRNLTSFNTGFLSHVTEAYRAWYECRRIVAFNASGLSSLISAEDTWYGNFYLESFDASAMTSLVMAQWTWQNCIVMKSFDASGLTSVTNAFKAWYGCVELLDFDTSALTKVTDVSSSWFRCPALKSFNASGLTSITKIANSWDGCHELICIGGTLDTTSCTVKTKAFFECNKLTSPDASTQTQLVSTAGLSWTNPGQCPPAQKKFKSIVFASNQADAVPTMFSGVSADVSVDPVTTPTISIADNGDGSWTVETDDEITGVHWMGKNSVTKINIVNAETVTHFEDSNIGNVTLWTVCINLPLLTDFECSNLSSEMKSISMGWKNCPALETFSIKGSNGIIQAKSAWEDCIGLTSFDASALGSLVMAEKAWTNCKELTSFDASALTSLVNVKEAWMSNFKMVSFDASGLTSVTHADSAWKFSGLLSFDASTMSSLLIAVDSWRSCEDITSFDASGLTSLENATESWFGCTALTSFDASGLTSVTHADRAWDGCIKMTSFNASGLTSVEHAYRSWHECKALISFDTSALTLLTSVAETWTHCDSLTSFDTSGLILVVDAVSAWSWCGSLTSFDASGLSEVVNVKTAWYNCLELIDFDTSALTKAEDINSSWEGCTKMTSFNASGLTSIKSMSRSWYKCHELICIGGTLDTTSCTDKTKAFFECNKLTSPDASTQAQLVSTAGLSWTNPGQCPSLQKKFKSIVFASNQADAVPTMFSGVSADVSVDPVTTPTISIADNGDGSWTVETDDEITGVHWMGKNSVTKINIVNAETVTHFEDSNIGNVTLWTVCHGLALLTDFHCGSVSDGMKSIELAFFGCEKMSSCIFSGSNKITHLDSAWSGNLLLETCPTDSFTSATSAMSAWGNCYALTSFDTSGLTSLLDASGAWYRCKALTSFNASGLTSVTNVFGAWHTCQKLTSFDTSALTSATNAKEAWKGCSKLASFNASGLTSIDTIQSAWQSCGLLVCIGGTLDTTSCTTKTDAFKFCFNITSPDASTQTQLVSTAGLSWTNPGQCP